MSFYLRAGLLSLFIYIIGIINVSAQKQAVTEDTLLQADRLSGVVVTATRSSRKLSDVPIPVNIIGQDEIQSSGASRLDEILSEQTGLAIIQNHGFGIQMQGMSPEYCLILINGEPLIGRTAGTLDLSQVTLNNVERIEIIKGPSSSLYGSDALGGVINIITEHAQRTNLSIQTKYGTNNTFDNTFTGSVKLNKKGGAMFSLNRFHSDGYDLTPDTYGKTISPYTDYTLRGGIHYQFTPHLKVSLKGRYFHQEQIEDFHTNSGKDTLSVKGKGKEEKIGITPELSYRFSPDWKLKLHSYWSQYKTKEQLNDVKSDTAYNHTFFTQNYWKEELQSENVLSATQVLTSGIGFTRESIRATRYQEKEFLSDYFLYLQHEWHPTPQWNILTGLRYDLPSAYHSQLSPKIAAQFKLNEHWHFQASVGTGYKSPDMRQLYLTFSNSVVGYSVMGAMVAKDGLADMQKEGLIDRVYIQPEELGEKLKPESSIAYNIGGSYTGNAGWKASVNLFRNDLKDMIDTRTIAMKSNGQPLYSYHNIHKVYTEGLETDVRVPLWNKHFILTAGYQFLIAKDKEVEEDIRQGNLFINDPKTGVKKLTMSDYGGLFNRSRHSLNIKLSYHTGTWSFNSRFNYRGRYGFADMNDDQILDAENEYAPGYGLVHLNIQKNFLQGRIATQFGIKNLLDYKDPQYLSYVSGRQWYVRATIQLFKNSK